MLLTDLPSCCHNARCDWPFSRRLDGVAFQELDFDPSRFCPEDFARAGIVPVRGTTKRQTEYLAGRLCALQALRQLGLPACPPGQDSERAPCWPASTTGAISHSHGQAAAVTARTWHWQGLGLDLEPLLPAPRADRLARAILTPHEARHYAELDPARRQQLVTLTFSLKESLFKALYPLTRQRFYFQDAELAESPGQGEARLRLRIPLSADWPAGSPLDGLFSLENGRVLSLIAIPGPAQR